MRILRLLCTDFLTNKLMSHQPQQIVLQVYAVAAYIEGAKAEREFGVRQRGGFFDADSGIGDYCDAILDAACSKLLVLQLVRDISGTQFVEV